MEDMFILTDDFVEAVPESDSFIKSPVSGLVNGCDNGLNNAFNIRSRCTGTPLVIIPTLSSLSTSSILRRNRAIRYFKDLFFFKDFLP